MGFVSSHLFQKRNPDRGCCHCHSWKGDEEINGPLQMEHALLFSFLDVSSDCKFKEQLHSLQSQQIMLCQGSDDDEVQTDGNRSGHFRNGDVGLAPTNEEVLRVIAAQLAEIGDQFDREIQERVVNGLVQHFLNENLSNEEITRHMSRVVGELMQAIPSDMEREKAMLVLAMVLTKKIVNTVPSLLRRVFDTTVNYMNRQFHNYIVDMLDTAGRSKAASTGSQQEFPHFYSITTDNL